jgi:DNA-directed RNA polymerase specialized sigma24 family protein
VDALRIDLAGRADQRPGEIWMHIWRHREALDLERAASFSGRLAVLARRRCIDLLREPRDPALAGEASEDEALAWLGTAAEQESALEGDELGEAVQLFKQKLKAPWREFFELHFERGLDYEEVCGRMSISRLRCKYMRKVLAMKARRNAEDHGRARAAGGKARCCILAGASIAISPATSIPRRPRSCARTWSAA